MLTGPLESMTWYHVLQFVFPSLLFGFGKLLALVNTLGVNIFLDYLCRLGGSNAIFTTFDPPPFSQNFGITFDSHILQ